MPSRPISRGRAGIFRRKASSKLSYRYRWLRLTSHDQVELRFLRKFFVYGLVLQHSGLDDNRIRDLLVLMSIKYLSIIFIFDPVLRLDSLPLRRSIDEFSESDCFIFFRFLKADLHLLCNLLPRVFPSYQGKSSVVVPQWILRDVKSSYLFKNVFSVTRCWES